MKKNVKKVSFSMSNIKSDFKKIEWPTKDHVVRSSIITIIMVSFFSIFVAGSDFILSKVIFIVK